MATRTVNPFIDGKVFYYQDIEVVLRGSEDSSSPADIHNQSAKFSFYRLGNDRLPGFRGVEEDEEISIESDSSDIGDNDGPPPKPITRVDTMYSMVESVVDNMDEDDIRDEIEKNSSYFGPNGGPLEDEKERILLFEYNGCASAKTFLSLIQSNQPQFPSELDKKLLCLHGSDRTQFLTGTQIYGLPPGTGEEKSTLFISIPYLGRNVDGPTQKLSESIHLSEFLGIDSGVPPGELIVHQAWFMTFGKGAIATFKSQESIDDNGSSPLERQYRVDIYHVIAHMISGVLNSDQSLIDEFRAKYHRHISYLRARKIELQKDPSLTTPEEKLLGVSNYLGIITAAIAVVKRQIRIVTKTVDRLLSCDSEIQYPKIDLEDFKRSRCTKNIIKLPVISKQTELLPYTLYVLEQSIESRQKVLAELEVIDAQVRNAYNSLMDLNLPPKKEAPEEGNTPAVTSAANKLDAPEVVKLLGEILETMKEMGTKRERDAFIRAQNDSAALKLLEDLENGRKTDAAARAAQTNEIIVSANANAQTQVNAMAQVEIKQAKDAASQRILMDAQLENSKWAAESMSWFTIITFIFLPLGFFTQYFALGAASPFVPTQRAFWRISGPITAVFLAAVIIRRIKKNYDWREIMDAIRGRRMPRTRAKIREIERKKREDDLENGYAGSSGARLLNNSNTLPTRTTTTGGGFNSTIQPANGNATAPLSQSVGIRGGGGGGGGGGVIQSSLLTAPSRQSTRGGSSMSVVSTHTTGN